LLANTADIAADESRPFYMLASEADASNKIVSSHKRKLLHYAMGIEASISDALAGGIFSVTPSYRLGWTGELGIGKHLGITAGLGYNEIHYSMDNPIHPKTDVYPYRYMSTLREIAIPIGVKAYPYVGRKISVNIGLAYINHVKIQEQFNYDLVKVPTTPRSGTLDPNQYTAIYPTDLKFGPSASSIDSIHSITDDIIDQNGYTSKYYSLAQANRYYGSIQMSVGVDAILSKHWIFSTEPVMNVSLSDIGRQNTKLYQLGVNIAAKYRF
jgi:hypothetical protein